MRVVNVLVLLAATGTTIGLASTEALAQSTAQSATQSVRLFSRYKNPPDQKRGCINFIKDHGPYQPCDLSYGNLAVGNELDWFNSSGGSGSRSVIKDLGEHSWSDRFNVPDVAPYPPLKPGENRIVRIDSAGNINILTTSAINGANGRRGVDGNRGQNTDGSVTQKPSIPQPVELGQPSPRRNIKPGTPTYVKAIVGHMYVIHVVDDENDFYALFRVDQLVRGDSCVVSWKLIDAPSVAK